MRIRYILALFLASAFAAHAQQIDTAAQLLASAHSVCVLEKQVYSEGKETLKGIQLPARARAVRLLKNAGLKVTDAETKDTDLSIDISIVGTSLSADYQLSGTLYTGALVEGSILITKGEERCALAFTGSVEPPQEATIGASGIRPFAQAFDQSDFHAVLLHVIATAFGAQPVVKALASPEPAVRCAAAAELAQSADESAGASLIPLLKDQEPDVRTAAADALGKLRTPAAVRPLQIAFKSGSNAAQTQFRVTALHALASLGDSSAVPTLLSALKSTDSKVRKASTEALEALGWAPASDQDRVTLAIAKGDLKEAASYGVAALPAILALVRDSDQTVSDSALSALAGMDEPKAVDALLALAKSRKEDDYRVRQSAILCLGTCKDARAFDALAQLLKDRDPSIVYLAQQSLGATRDPRAAGYLVPLLKGKNSGARYGAASALQTMGWQPASDDEALPFYSTLREWDKCASYGEKAIPYLLREACATGMADPVWAIVGMRTQAAIDALVTVLAKDPSADLRATAADTLGLMRATSAQSALKRALKDPDQSVREAAEDALGKIW